MRLLLKEAPALAGTSLAAYQPPVALRAQRPNSPPAVAAGLVVQLTVRLAPTA